MKNKIINVLKIIIILVIFIFLAVSLYAQANRGVFCAKWMNNYIQNPPTTIEDYTNKDIIFNELCGEDNYIYNLGGILILVIIFVGIAKKNKKRNEKTQSEV